MSPALPRPLVALAAGLLLPACFKPYQELSVLDFTDVPFDNGLVQSADAVIRTYETTLPCPDGNGARFYVVYRTGITEAAPVALVFHSGAFDYELDPTAADGSTLDGVTWRGESRLSRDWADKMIWATLGMFPDPVSQSEQHLGALPAALADAGVVQLFPGNCWGDLWHNESGYQDSDFALETFSRDGRTFAWWMVRMLTEEGFAANVGAELPFTPGDDLFLVGLGDGGRGALELLVHPGMPAVEAVLVDSSPDRMSAYLDPTLELEEEVAGIERLWPDPLDRDEIDDWSLYGLVQAQGAPAIPGLGDTGAPPRDTGEWGGFDDTGRPPLDSGTQDSGSPPSLDTGVPRTGGIEDLGSFALPTRLALVWSQADPQQPRATTEATAGLLAERESAWVVDTQAPGHVFSNADPAAAATLVEYLLYGNRGELTWESLAQEDSQATARTAECTP